METPNVSHRKAIDFSMRILNTKIVQDLYDPNCYKTETTDQRSEFDLKIQARNSYVRKCFQKGEVSLFITPSDIQKVFSSKERKSKFLSGHERNLFYENILHLVKTGLIKSFILKRGKGGFRKGVLVFLDPKIWFTQSPSGKLSFQKIPTYQKLCENFHETKKRMPLSEEKKQRIIQSFFDGNESKEKKPVIAFGFWVSSIVILRSFDFLKKGKFLKRKLTLTCKNLYFYKKQIVCFWKHNQFQKVNSKTFIEKNILRFVIGIKA